MVRVEAPPVTVPPPLPRDRVSPWLAGVAVALLGLAFVPWERWCGTKSFVEVELCFSARLWGGSASHLGSIAIVLLVAYLIATARVGFRTRVRAGRLALFAGALAAIVAKSIIVAANGQIASEANPLDGPAWLGVWISPFLAVAGISLLATTASNARRHPRSIAVPVLTALAIVAGAIPYARSGLAWWGGPLAEPTFLGGGNGSGHVVEPGEPHLFQTLLYVRNLGRSTITFDSLELVDSTGTIRVLDTYVTEFTPCTDEAVTLDVELVGVGCLYELSGHRLRPGDRKRSVLLAMVYEVPRAGVYRSGWFRIRYHTGPFHFEVFRTDELVICAPEQGKKRCPGDGF